MIKNSIVILILILVKLLNYELTSPMRSEELEKTIINAKNLYKNVDIKAAQDYITDKVNYHRYPTNIISLSNYKYNTKTDSPISTPSAASSDTGVATTSTNGGSDSGGSGY